MKKVLLTLITMACAVSVFAQGTAQFNNRIAGTIDERIYGLVPGNDLAQIQGPMATTDWQGAARIEGTGFTAQLFGGPLGTADDALAPAPLQLNFRTGTAAGIVANAAAVAISGVNEGQSARIQMRVWDNRGGTITSWADVLADDTIARGYSRAFNSLPLGGTLTTPPALIGLEAFNLFVVPEPSILALGALGIGALILFRRRK